MDIDAWSELRRDPSSGDLLFGCQISDYIPPSTDGTQTLQALNYIYAVWYRISSGTHDTPSSLQKISLKSLKLKIFTLLINDRWFCNYKHTSIWFAAVSNCLLWTKRWRGGKCLCLWSRLFLTVISSVIHFHHSIHTTTQSQIQIESSAHGSVIYFL
jgi:hypothetical protein